MKKLIKCWFIIAILGNGLSGCVSNKDVETLKIAQSEQAEENKVTQSKLIEKITKLENSQQQWQEVQPSVIRLVAIEQELNTLIAQLNVIVDEVESKKEQMLQSEQAKKAIDKRKNTAKEKRHYSLQLITLSDAKTVEQSWLSIKNKQANLLSDQLPLIETIEINNKNYYRIKAGRFSTFDDANKMCKQLKRQKTSCLVNPSLGKELSQFKAENGL